MSDIDPFDPELARALRGAPVPEPPEGARERVLGRLVAALPAIATPAASPRLDAGAPPAPPALAAIGSLTGKGVALVAVTFVVGGAVAGLSVSALHHESPRVIHVAPPAPASPASSSLASPPPPPTPSELPAPPPAPSATSHAEVRAPSSVAASPGERPLIDDARRHLADGDARAALGELSDHERRFPRGQLEEEREALAIQALVQLGRFGDAQSRASSFRRRWPESVYLPAVEATLHSIP